MYPGAVVRYVSVLVKLPLARKRDRGDSVLLYEMLCFLHGLGEGCKLPRREVPAFARDSTVNV